MSACLAAGFIVFTHLATMITVDMPRMRHGRLGEVVRHAGGAQGRPGAWPDIAPRSGRRVAHCAECAAWVGDEVRAAVLITQEF